MFQADMRAVLLSIEVRLKGILSNQPKESGHGKIWMFPKIGVPKNGWFIMENSIKMDDLGGKPTILGNTHMVTWFRWRMESDFFPPHKG